MLAGPVLRRIEPGRLVLWLVGSAPLDLTLVLAPKSGAPRRLALDARRCRVIRVGRHACVHLIDVALPEPLPQDTTIEYDLLVAQGDGTEAGIAQWAPHLLHVGATRPSMVLRSRSDNILYGSCRKPHHPARDGLARADALLADHAQLSDGRADERPAMLMLCGDQVYADDVAGPMLAAIHALIRRLGLYGECLEGAVVADSEALYRHQAGYYRREELLPATRSNDALRDRFFGGSEKPIFTTVNAHNHLVTFAEVMAMYLLVWSPVPWQLVADAPAPPFAPRYLERWRRESRALEGFRRDLPQAARLLAHVQTLMIFDDHDITDDWNLSAKWEATVYGHTFSRRIVGNALIAYMLCQGWGNRPDVFEAALDDVAALAASAALDDRLDAPRQDALIERLLSFGQWDFVVRAKPTIIVLDTRTRRWRNRRRPGHPSGLMDWESLTELQHELLDETAAVIVSPTPMFGVKLIEVIQRVATFAGLALKVDAENWMEHRGAASSMLNIFRHSRSPRNYVVLSGDVHYSFAYDVEVRDSDRTPHIWQITSSGIKNEFPHRLLDWLDRLNRWLYSPRSPLNWFTKRRDLALTPYLPDARQHGERVWNGAGIGQVWLDAQGRPVRIVQHNADGGPSTRFLAPGQEASLAGAAEQPLRKH
ncbi:alkaline phosphatase D family protein [Massilia sp. BSC265]|uniref:alkaline phosphatase D family protein n=1 Tax=Massilia sp. BSC265 TaxID=1549812 RepID=UPI0004E8B4C5|nr:isoleucyl-tRNA synthetase [Massilia sp. BSC265]